MKQTKTEVLEESKALLEELKVKRGGSVLK